MPQQMPPSANDVASRRWLLLATGVALLAALAQTYPAWTMPGSGVIGNWQHPDMISNHWLYLWIRDQVLSGGSLLHNDRYYVPVGDAPWLAGNGSDALPWLVIGSWMPWPLSMTVWAILIITLNGVSAATLARTLGAREAGAAVAAALLAFSPYVAAELSGARYAQAPLYWLVFFLAAWVRLLEAPSARRGLLAGALYAACAFTYWYYGLWAALAGAVLFALRPAWKALVSFVPAALVLTGPPLALFLRHWSAIPGTTEGDFPHRITVDTGLFAAFPVWGGEGVLHALVLSLVGLLGAAAALRRQMPWHHRGMVVIAVVFYLLALGPYLLDRTGEATEIPGPFLLLYGSASVLRRFWWPYRHIAVLSVALAALAAQGVERLLAGRGRLGALLAAGLVVLIPVEQAARGGTSGVQVSAWEPPAHYQQLAALPGEAIVGLPLNPAIASTQAALSYQWVHGKAMVNGHAMWVDRVRPDAWDAWVADNSLLQALSRAEEGKNGRVRVNPRDVQALRDQGVRYIVLDAEFYPEPLHQLLPAEHYILGLLFGDPVYAEGTQLLVWDLEKYSGIRHFDTSHVSAPGEIQIPERGRAPGASQGWRLLTSGVWFQPEAQ